MIHSASPPRAARALLRPALRHSLLALAAMVGFSTSPAHAQFADWEGLPPKILPNERIGSGPGFFIGSGRQTVNSSAFAALTADGSILSWGDASSGGSGAPTGSGYKAIYSSQQSFAALTADGSIKVWGDAAYTGSGVPTDSGYTAIHSVGRKFSALKADGSISSWGYFGSHDIAAPTDSGYKAIYTSAGSFSALKADGSISVWGNSNYGGSGAPVDNGYTRIYSNSAVFTAMKADGSVTSWGGLSYGGVVAPTGSGFTAISSTEHAFAALKADGSITAWGPNDWGGSGAPVDGGYTTVCSTQNAFAALKADGSIKAWGNAGYGGSGAPTESGFTAIVSSQYAFAALKADGTIKVWGFLGYGDMGTPTTGGFKAIYSGTRAFAALKADGSITAWGNSNFGGSGAPTDSGYRAIYSNDGVFAAVKADGSIRTWGNATTGGNGAPAGTGYTLQSVFYYPPLLDLNYTLGTVTASSAVLGGNVIAAGGKTLTERGVVYAATGANSDPKISGTGVTQLVESPAGTLGEYSFDLSDLSRNTAYSFRAYVADSNGVAYYSGVGVFSTNLAPVITSNGGGSGAVLSIAENNTVATTVLATDADSPAQVLGYGISGGADAARFSIHPSTGELSFVTAPDFESPADAGADNRYELIIQATDDGNFPKSASQALTIQVTNLAELAQVTTPTVTGISITGAILGGTVVHDGGGGDITERGVVYALTSTNGDPQLGGSGVAKLTVTGTTGTFSRGLGGLVTTSGYSFKAYATNASGTAYSSAASFTTLGTNAAPGFYYETPQFLQVGTAVNFSPIQIGTSVPAGPYAQVTNFAGSGTAGTTDASGTNATFKRPVGLAVDAAGNVYVADNANHKIRKISSAGAVTTLAGDGYATIFTFGRLKNGTGTVASFNYPCDIALDEARECLYIADRENDAIRRISLSAGSYAVVETFATGFDKPEGIAMDASGQNLYVANYGSNRISKIVVGTKVVTNYAGTGTASALDHASSALSATFNKPTGVAVDAGGNVYVADFGNNKLRKIAANGGAVSSLGGGTAFSGPYGVELDGAGNLYVTEQTGARVSIITPANGVSVLAGSGSVGTAEGIGTAASFHEPSGIAIHSDGVAYISHYANAATGHKIRKINLAGYRLTGTLPAGLSFNATTGVISGTPTGAHAPLSFTVSEWNYLGSSSTTLNLAISFDPVFATAGQPLLAANGFVAGGVVLGDLRLGFVPAPGAILTLVNNTGSSPVSGIFVGLPEGSMLTTTAGGETFHFQISYLGGTGNDITLTRSAGPGQVAQSAGAFTPILTKGEVSALSLTSATLNGTVNPNGFITTARFEYGKTTSYGSTVAVTLADPANTTAQAVSAALVELTAGTRYYYRLTASNVDGTSQTVDGTFWTDSLPSLMTILYSTNITTTSATLGGIVSGGSLITGRGVVYAEVGVNADPRIGGDGVTQVSETGTYGPFTTAVTGLTPDTAYCFRVYATNAYGLTYSDMGSFTSAAPIVPGEVTLLDNTAGGTAEVSNGGNGISSGGRWGMAFTTGTKAYQFSSMRTAFFYGAGTLSVSLYAVDSGQQTDGEAIFTKTYAPQQFDTVAYYTWALPAVELAPDTSYMLVLRCVSGSINWMTNGVAPTSTAGFVFKSIYVTSPGQAWSAAGVRFALSLTGTPPPAAPTLAADPISAHVTATTATLGGEVTTDGGAAITERGVVYAATATNPAPEIGGAGVTRLTAPGTTGTFYLEVGSLAPETAYSVRAYATNSFGTSYSEVRAFTTQPGVTRSHQQEWRFANFGAYDSENSGADAADPDGDGLSNLLEYALGLDPNTSGVMPAVLVLNGANLEYTYSRDTAARENGINYQIEWSDTLDVGSWSTETVTEEILSTEAALETVKTSVPAGSGGKRFLRLRVN